ncbi:hypothetical protein IHE44_0013656, partial [Lamprotornis superbus]
RGSCEVLANSFAARLPGTALPGDTARPRTPGPGGCGVRLRLPLCLDISAPSAVFSSHNRLRRSPGRAALGLCLYWTKTCLIAAFMTHRERGGDAALCGRESVCLPALSSVRGI